eukprot:gene5201-7239_t
MLKDIVSGISLLGNVKSSSENSNESQQDIRDSTASQTTELIEKVHETEIKKDLQNQKIDLVIQEKILRDSSPEAKAGRRKMMIRACYGEFMCSILFYTPIFGVLANGRRSGWSPELTAVAVSFVGGFQAIGNSFAFSSVSGAHFNSAISFALWLTGKLSNRKCAFYILVQLLASIISMCIIASIFPGDLQSIYVACSVTPVDSNDLGRVFSTEFFLTFFLTYIAFTVAFEDAERSKKESMSFKTISDSKGLTLYASTPQSKTGFAPFSIGMTIFSLSLIGGNSGGAFNPGRLLGPAVFSGKWDALWLYWIAEVLGASFAGLLVSNMHRFGLQAPRKDEMSAKDFATKILPSTVEPSVNDKNGNV